MFFLTHFLVATIILLVGCISDLKHRKASNWLWVVLGVSGFVLNSSLANFEALYTLFVIIVTCMVVYALKLIGGADIKALISLTLLYPNELIFLVYVIVISCCISLFAFLFKSKWEMDNPFLFSLLIGYLVCSAYFVTQ